ncbi:hypothetical protein [Novosphingobium sp. UBA1939]|uniref:hypothetical protein n=1 Tax=Novosphingobium sp. UBA1939 TaxID=1946982 RepID=UPI0025D9988F|nr:hypothetical protein [Novosphingobium sp. UBA1939]
MPEAAESHFYAVLASGNFVAGVVYNIHVAAIPAALIGMGRRRQTGSNPLTMKGFVAARWMFRIMPQG